MYGKLDWFPREGSFSPLGDSLVAPTWSVTIWRNFAYFRLIGWPRERNFSLANKYDDSHRDTLSIHWITLPMGATRTIRPTL